jgi:hypothetical protein
MTGSGMGCWQVPCIAANTRRTPRQLRVGLRPGARANVASDTGTLACGADWCSPSSGCIAGWHTCPQKAGASMYSRPS